MTINRIHVLPYWGALRYYRYTVDASTDCEVWKQVANMSDNSKPATGRGG